MQLKPSELILNADGSIYHLNLHPQDIAPTIITVGDPERVTDVSNHFDTVEIKKGKREFITHTGTLNGKRLTVISTGIGTDNIDIVLNELDALVNIDLESRTVKDSLTQLSFIRIGTSGAIQESIPIDSFIISEFAVGFDSLLHFYQSEKIQHFDFSEALVKHMEWPVFNSVPYVVKVNNELFNLLKSNKTLIGITTTNSGFYAPQGRSYRLAPKDADFLKKLISFRHKNKQITNLEMETSGIYGLAKLMGHKAVSMNCILANRSTGGFSKTPEKSIENIITYTLSKLTE
jgi:uridine phosphorylase